MLSNKGLILAFLLMVIPLQHHANSSCTRISEQSYGYLLSFLPSKLMTDFSNLRDRSFQITVIHPNFGIQRVSGAGFAYDLNTIALLTTEKLGKLPDLINPIILLDSDNTSEKRHYYRHIDNQVYWTFKRTNQNPDDITGLPTGPQPYSCGTELCACVIGGSGSGSCDGMSLVAKGACRNDDGIKICCQKAGTTPVDTNGGTTTTCTAAGTS